MVPPDEAALGRCVTAEGWAAARDANADARTRFLELALPAILAAGPKDADGRDRAPTARHSAIGSRSSDAARRMTGGPPRHVGGVHPRCEATAIDTVLGTSMGGVARPTGAGSR